MADMQRDNDVLAETIARMCLVLGRGERVQTRICVMAAAAVYGALKAQAEVDRLWSVDALVPPEL